VPGVVEALADASAEKAQVNLELAEGSVTCHLAGELSGSRAKAALEVCDRLLGCFAEVRIDTRGLSESSRALFARLRSEANSARAADSAA
jgi:hypothetical protein